MLSPPRNGRALVTGASSGLGTHFARLLAADGFDLVLVARSRDKLEALAAELNARYGVRADVVVQDLGEAGAADAVFARAPLCDVLINNAGFASHGAFAALPEARIAEELAVDVVALTQLARKYVPGMIARKNGRILNVASTAAFLPGPYMAVYYASKAYVMSFSLALSEELRGTGVTVTCLCPAATATGFSERADVGATPLFKAYQADAADVAQAGVRAMLRGRRLETAPAIFRFLMPAIKFVPLPWLLWGSRKSVGR